MEGDKRFLIGKGKRSTSVSVGLYLGRILQRSEVAEMARGYGSEVRRYPSFTSIDIVPPIPSKDLDKFGKALVKLAISLDRSPPLPDYKITEID